MKKLLLILLSVFVLVVVLVLIAGSALLEKAVVAGVETVGPEITQAPVELEDVKISLSSGKCSIIGLNVGSPDGFKSEYVMRLKTLRLKLQPQSLFRDKIVVDELVIDAPELIYETKLTGTNLGAILKHVNEFSGGDEGAPPSAADEEATGGKRFEVRLIKVTNGKVTLANQLLQGEQLVVSLPPIEIRDLGSGPEGATLGDIVRRTLASINAETVKAVAQSGHSVGDQLRRNADTLKDRVGGLLGGLKKLSKE